MHLSGQILLHVMPGNKDPTFEPPTLQLQVLPLPPEQVGLFLCLVDDIAYHQYLVCETLSGYLKIVLGYYHGLQTWRDPDLEVLDVLFLLGQPLLFLFLRCRLVLTQFLAHIFTTLNLNVTALIKQMISTVSQWTESNLIDNLNSPPLCLRLPY